MNILTTSLDGVVIVEPKIYSDNRGYFFESSNEREFRNAGLPTHWAQDNQSQSQKNVLRGIHYQIQNAQGKLVRVLHGTVFDVAVDLRRNSRTFGKWFGLELSDQNRKMLWIPPGFGHGFLVLTEIADFAYRTTRFYSPGYERTLLWNDPTVRIKWPLSGEPALSDKDRAGVLLTNAEVYEQEPIT